MQYVDLAHMVTFQLQAHNGFRNSITYAAAARKRLKHCMPHTIGEISDVVAEDFSYWNM